MSSEPKLVFSMDGSSRITDQEKENIKKRFLKSVVFGTLPWFWADESQAGSEGSIPICQMGSIGVSFQDIELMTEREVFQG